MKLVHRIIDSIDFYEHRVYEILRGIDAKTRVSGEEPKFSEIIVNQELKKARKAMYAKAWRRILKGKGED